MNYKNSKGDKMKKIIIALLIAIAIPLHADITTTAKVDSPKISAEVVAELNKPLVQEQKVSTGSWIALGLIVVVGIVFGSMSWNTKQPI
jgi:hypothetical protein